MTEDVERPFMFLTCYLESYKFEESLNFSLMTYVLLYIYPVRTKHSSYSMSFILLCILSTNSNPIARYNISICVFIHN
jgi:hypothetical protein